ncbi:MAG: hypothetical protein ACF8NJ_07730 [Phycisphaerales bacterium JB038]
MLFQELDRASDDYTRRVASLQNKAALVVTGSAILAGIAATASPVTALATTALAALASATGVFLMLPKKSLAVSPTKLREVWLAGPPSSSTADEARLQLFDTRADLLAQAEAKLPARARLLTLAFFALALAILPLLLEAMATSGLLSHYTALVTNS